MDKLDTLVSIALDLTAALNASDRYHRLLEALGRVIPFDAAALLRLEGDELFPLAARGLSLDAMGRRYPLKSHPRLEIICNAMEPVRFSKDSSLPDPFDGLLINDSSVLQPIHGCLGCPLHVDNKLIGVLTADAVDPQIFDNLDQRFLTAIGALAGAQMRTANLIEMLQRSAERQGLIAQDLMRDIQMRQGTQLLGNSAVMVHLRQEIELVGRSDFNVLITGETGVGKELVARAIHAASRRRENPMLYLNCAALPETLAESELFGHTKGAFTGANMDRAGKFEVADGGTLFLDEIGELSLSLQPKLLRTIQEGEIQRVGTDQIIHVNVRLLAATNRDLEQEVKSGRFRADLFHRLNVYPIRIPPLRERQEDIPILAGYFCDLAQRQLGLGTVRLNADTIELLIQHSWPGNVRELDNVISRAILKASSEFPQDKLVIVSSQHLGGDFSSLPPQSQPSTEEIALSLTKEVSLREAVKEYEKTLIQRALNKNKGNWAAAARDLKMNRSNLHNLATRLGLRE